METILEMIAKYGVTPFIFAYILYHDHQDREASRQTLLKAISKITEHEQRLTKLEEKKAS